MIVFMNVLGLDRYIGTLLKIMNMKVRNLKSLPALSSLAYCNVSHIYVYVRRVIFHVWSFFVCL